jgi:hypothetical protein
MFFYLPCLAEFFNKFLVIGTSAGLRGWARIGKTYTEARNSALSMNPRIFAIPAEGFGIPESAEAAS